MMRSLFSAVSGLKSNQTAMDVIGNNIANVNTVGYKSSRVVFQDIYSQTITSATAPTTTSGGMNAKQVGLGVSIASISQNLSDGSTEATSDPLDFAITGDGYFVIQKADGTYAYTRDGAFTTDAQGFLVDANGNYVMSVVGDATAVANGSSTATLSKIQIVGPVTSPAADTYSNYAIDSNGVVTAISATSGKVVTIGRLVLATFNNAGGLEKDGSNYLVESSNSGTSTVNFVNNGCGLIKSGSLEMSNVDLATELTNMIIAQRGFQANSRVITTSDSMLEELVNLKR